MFFFFKQKTAYGMRISDWSSDVCSSDLKAGMDKFAADMAVDLKDSKVAALSIWMGALQTERLLQLIASDRDKYGYLENITETPDFTGHVIWALYNDRSEEHTSELQSLMRISYAVFCLKKKTKELTNTKTRLTLNNLYTN